MNGGRAMKRKGVAWMVLLAVLIPAGCARRPAADPGASVSAAATPAETRTAAPSAAQTPETAESRPPQPSRAPEGETPCYIGADRVRVREAAGVESAVLCVLPCGTELIRLECGEEWSKVRYGDITGYVRNDLLSAAEPEPRPAARVTGYLPNARVVVRKSLRILELWDGNTLIGSYSVGLGWTPEGPKRAEGDGRTPEGEYYVCLRNPNSSYYLSLGLSYPNKDDAKAGLDGGRISQSAYNQIAEAIDSRQRPPWNTALGGEIMIHGHGGGRDWTAGCVAVDDEVMDILWAACPIGTPVTILP